jgi:integrase/recombinase XerC
MGVVPSDLMGKVIVLRPLRGADGLLALDALESWLAEYAGVGGRSPVSVDSQRRHVRATLSHIAAAAAAVPVDELELAECSRETVVEALLTYRTAPDARFTTHPDRAATWKSDESVRRRASALRTFFGWCVRTERLLQDPTLTIQTPRAKPALPKALSESEDRAVLVAALGGPWPARDVALLNVAVGAGPRLAELVGMRTTDLSGDPPVAVTVLGKGAKERRLSRSPLAGSTLGSYLTERAERLRALAVDDDALWLACRPTDRGGSPSWSMELTRHGVAEIIGRCLSDDGVTRPGLRVHVLRHTFATLALTSRAYTVRELQEALGHAGMSTTGRYLKVTDADLAHAAAAHPLAR